MYTHLIHSCIITFVFAVRVPLSILFSFHGTIFHQQLCVSRSLSSAFYQSEIHQPFDAIDHSIPAHAFFARETPPALLIPSSPSIEYRSDVIYWGGGGGRRRGGEERKQEERTGLDKSKGGKRRKRNFLFCRAREATFPVQATAKKVYLGLFPTACFPAIRIFTLPLRSRHH